MISLILWIPLSYYLFIIIVLDNYIVESHVDKVNSNLPWFLQLPNTDLPRSQMFNYFPRIFQQNDKVQNNFRSDIFVNLYGYNHRGYKKRILKQAQQGGKIQKYLNEDTKFPCDVSFGRSQQPPDNVHEVRPGDIDIVAAMGDSITAGNGITATSLIQVSSENKGLSWSIGGQGDWKTAITLPNILKNFNPNIFGYSYGDSYTNHKGSQFNVAEIGAMSKDLFYMSKELVKRIKNDPRTDLVNHWKLITIMMGSNDFCIDLCYAELDKVVERHEVDLVKTLNYLKEKLPRTIVNLVIQPNLNILVSGKYPAYCNMMQRLLCPCLFAIQYEKLYKRYTEIMIKWQQIEFKVIDMDMFKTKPDFTVIAQPFTMNLTVPTIKNSKNSDMRFMAPDCFHLSQKSQALAGNSVWNNMMEPINNKSTSWSPLYEKFNCPSVEHPYIYTWKNS